MSTLAEMTRQHAERHLPKATSSVDELPKVANGKVDRTATPASAGGLDSREAAIR